MTVMLSDLSIGYTSKQKTTQVAGPLTASLESGELTCLLGPNGVGKSTLLRTLAAFQKPLSGQMELLVGAEHSNLSLLSSSALSKLIGVVLTEKPDVRQMTVWELVAMGRQPYTGFWGRLSSKDRDVVDESMRMVGIDALRERMVNTLSDGERQKVMIAKVLAQQTPIIYLDEPTAFLDYPSKVDSMLLLKYISHDYGKTVLLSTHDLELALQVADKVWLMTKDGGLQIGPPHELARQGMLSRFIERRQGVVFDAETMSVRVAKDSVGYPRL